MTGYCHKHMSRVTISALCLVIYYICSIIGVKCNQTTLQTWSYDTLKIIDGIRYLLNTNLFVFV